MDKSFSGGYCNDTLICHWTRVAMSRWWLLLVFLWCSVVAHAEWEVVYPADESPLDTRFEDLKEILRTALEITEEDFGPFDMRSVEIPMTSLRYSQELRSGRFPNVIWTSTSRAREENLRPIRIPLRKGLLSYRVSIIRSDTQARLRQVTTLEDLMSLSLVQGTGWGDVQVYESNGLTVITSGYESLFRMIQAGRADLFPRGIGEVFPEWEARREAMPNLAIDEHLLLYYPWPYYFFVNKEDDALAERLETGLMRMIENGSFDEIFWRYNGVAIRRAQLQDRQLITLDNPLLPAQTPLDDKKLWFRPQ